VSGRNRVSTSAGRAKNQVLTIFQLARPVAICSGHVGKNGHQVANFHACEKQNRIFRKQCVTSPVRLPMAINGRLHTHQQERATYPVDTIFPGLDGVRQLRRAILERSHQHSRCTARAKSSIFKQAGKYLKKSAAPQPAMWQSREGVCARICEWL